MADRDKLVQDFVGVTGASAETAGKLLDSFGGNLEQAVTAYFDGGAEGAAPAGGAAADADEPMPDGDAETDDAPTSAALPSPSSGDLVASILAGAAKPEDEPRSWSSGGRALGSAADVPAGEDAPSDAAAEAAAPLDRRNAKKVRVIFWSDGFTVEDVTAEESEEAAKEAAEKAAPRRTGLATLGSASERAASRPQMPKLPPLRKYEDNPQFMDDLQKGIPPLELREIDLSSGTPRPRPVDIMLGDLKSTPYPAEAAARQAARQAQQDAPAKPVMTAFSGVGQALGGGSSAATSSSSGSSGTAAAGAEWERAGSDAPKVDEQAPTTTVQVRLASGEAPPQRLRLNQTHTVLEMLVALERGLQAAGVASRPYVLMDGFPPKPLQASDTTLKDAGLLGASVTLKWS